MKKILSTLTTMMLSTTASANILKPLFTNNTNANDDFKKKLINKQMNIENQQMPQTQSVSNPFIKKINNLTNIRAIAITKNNLYIGTTEGLFKSADNGNTFKATKFKGHSVLSLAIASNDDIYIGTDEGLFKSTNGVNFKKLNHSMVHDWQRITSLAVDKNETIFVGTDDELFKSTDNGNTFTNITQEVTGTIRNLIIAPNDDIYIGTDEGLFKSTNGVNFKKLNHSMVHDWQRITSLAVDKNETIFVGTDDELFKSTDNGNTFTNITQEVTGTIRNLIIAPNDEIFVGTDNGLYASNSKNLLLKINKPNTFDKTWEKGYKGIVYNSTQKIDIKDELVATATLNGSTKTVISTNIDIPVGENTLILTLKDKSLATAYGGNPATGEVTYKIWVKTTIDKNKIRYSTIVADTDLFSGLIGDVKRVVGDNEVTNNGSDIIQTRSKEGTGKHLATLSFNISDTLINYDLSKSFYVKGTVNNNNNFTETDPRIKLTENATTKITDDGIYWLHLEDLVGNKYDSYLELGESNWKLKANFDDKTFNDNADKLNVTVTSISQKDKQKANVWLNKYKTEVEKVFNKAVKKHGKGFDISLKTDFKDDYTSFLDPVPYVDNNTAYNINEEKLKTEITIIADKKLKAGLSKLPQYKNVDTSNVVDKTNLDQYTIWINKYHNFIDTNKQQWINKVINIASRGFASVKQIKTIKNYITSLNFKNYLKEITWIPKTFNYKNSNTLNLLSFSTATDEFSNLVDLDKFTNYVINWTNKNIPEINQAYVDTINQAENTVNLHGYSIKTILDGKSKPQTKSEIENFADKQNYQTWLQSQADIKFHSWQLSMGLGIGLPLALIVGFSGLGLYWRHDPQKRPLFSYWKRKIEKREKKKIQLTSKKVKEKKEKSLS